MTGVFRRITVLPGVFPPPALLDAVRPFSARPVVQLSAWPPPAPELTGCADSDCVLASWKDSLTAVELHQFPDLRYIGLRATSTERVDFAYTRRHGITVAPIHHYGDVGTVEFVVLRLLRHARPEDGTGVPQELAGLRLGLIGYGAVGARVGAVAAALGMDVMFHTPSSRPSPDGSARWSPLDELLATSDVISFHSPAFREVVTEQNLARACPAALVLITTLGLPMSATTFRAWQTARTGTTALDRCAAHDLDAVTARLPGVVIHEGYAARTVQSIQRAEALLLDNLRAAVT